MRSCEIKGTFVIHYKALPGLCSAVDFSGFKDTHTYTHIHTQTHTHTNTYTQNTHTHTHTHTTHMHLPMMRLLVSRPARLSAVLTSIKVVNLSAGNASMKLHETNHARTHTHTNAHTQTQTHTHKHTQTCHLIAWQQLPWLQYPSGYQL